VPASEATDLLVLAFLAEAIDEIEDEAGRHPLAAGAMAGGGGAAEPMSVSRDIVATWRRPRRVMRRLLAQGRREDRAIMFLMGLRDHLRVAMARHLAGGGA
jgi:hypothetical protein